MRSEYEGTELDLILLKHFLCDLKKYNFQTRLCLTGGEPTVYSRLNALMQLVRLHEMSVYIVTNGQKEKAFKDLVLFKDILDWVSISLDGPSPGINDQTRGHGSFFKVIKSIHLLHSGGIPVDLRFVLHDSNIHAIDDMFRLADSLHIKRLRFSTLHPTKKTHQNHMSTYTGKINHLQDRIQNLKMKFPLINAGINTRHIVSDKENEWSNKKCIPIKNTKNGITLLPDGKISFCCDLYDLDFEESRYVGENKPLNPIIGDYSKESLNVILKRKSFLIEELKRRRSRDVDIGILNGPRQFICENCKFYFYHKSKPQ